MLISYFFLNYPILLTVLKNSVLSQIYIRMSCCTIMISAVFLYVSTECLMKCALEEQEQEQEQGSYIEYIC